MSLPAALSVRARLTLWHAGVLTLIICVFSAGTFLFVRGRLYRALDEQLGADLATIEKVYREETGDLGELGHRMGITLFRVAEGSTVIYQTPGWPPGGPTPYRRGAWSDASHRIDAARDETALRQTLWTLGVILAIGVPCAVGLAIGGGYVLAGRVLSPVGAMAETARKISAESLADRLPVGNPQDEFGRLATVFNDTLSRLDEAFEQLRRFTAGAAHELRTPLTAIRSVGEVALQRSLSAVGYREVIGSMLEEVDRLTRLVDSLLTLTRGESGRIRPSLRRAGSHVTEIFSTASRVTLCSFSSARTLRCSATFAASPLRSTISRLGLIRPDSPRVKVRRLSTRRVRRSTSSSMLPITSR